MPSFGEGVAARSGAQEIMRINEVGILSLRIENQGDSDAIVSFFRKGAGGGSHAKSDAETFATQTVNDGESVLAPVIPKSFALTGGGSPAMLDRDGDGVLRLVRDLDTPLAEGVNGVTSAATTRTLTSAGATFTTAPLVHIGDTLIIAKLGDKGVYTIVTVAATVLTVDRDFPVGGLSALNYKVMPVDLDVGSVNYFSGLLDLTLPTTAAPTLRAKVTGTQQFPTVMNAGDTLIVSGDTAGGGTATFDAAAATSVASGGTFAAMAAETMEIQIDNSGIWQLVTFGTEATIGLAATAIEDQVVGVTATPQGAQDVDLASTTLGLSSNIQTRNVDAAITTKLGIADAVDEDGTGDVADIVAVTFLEFKTVVEADMTTIECTLDEGIYPAMSSTTAEVGASSTIEVTGGTGRGSFGFPLGELTGADSGAEAGITATYVQSTVIPAGTFVNRNVSNLGSGELVLEAIGNGGNSRIRVQGDIGR